MRGAHPDEQSMTQLHQAGRLYPDFTDDASCCFYLRASMNHQKMTAVTRDERFEI